MNLKKIAYSIIKNKAPYRVLDHKIYSKSYSSILDIINLVLQ